MDWRENLMDFIGGEQRRPLLGLLFIAIGLIGFVLFGVTGGFDLYGSLR